MIAFILGREYRLSIAEIYNFFANSSCIFASREIAIFKGVDEEEVITNFSKLGGSIKAIKINKEIETEKQFITESIKTISTKNNLESGKFCYGIAQYEFESDIFTIGLQIKKELKKSGVTNVRFVNKDKNNINAAAYKKEKLNTSGIELNILSFEDKILFGETIVYQDVDSYSARDYGKTRDMQVGMLPPKLAQMMINLGRARNHIFYPPDKGELKGVKKSEFGRKQDENNPPTPLIRGTGNVNYCSQLLILNSIYDPFCGLGTVLIEAAIAGYKKIFGSDISEAMVNASEKNIAMYIEAEVDVKIFKQDASNIDISYMFKNNSKLLNNFNIVSEGYLGNIMTKGHVTEDKIFEERKNLARIYNGFFSGLRKLKFRGNIVISFPFWELKGKYIYFEEIYNILKKNGLKVQKLLPENIEFRETKSGSLLYHRPGQQVGREIFCLKF